ncbi:MAG: hypothetical protein ACFBSE_00310 [Prochloraceae cyanobacterium]
MKSIAVIVGSAFAEKLPLNLDLDRLEIKTFWGKQALHRLKNNSRHRLLSDRIDYRSHF